MSFVRKYVFSIDHKIIGLQFLFTGLGFLALGGVMAMMIRWQWGFPMQPVPVLGSLVFSNSGGAVTPAAYNNLFTMHGLIMIFWAITPILIGGFGNYLIPLLIGAQDMAFPRLNMYSFWTFMISAVLVIWAFFAHFGAAAAGWTTYPPLASNVGTPGMGQTLMVLALFVTGVSTIMGSINYVTTVIRLRAPGMTWDRLPITVWGLWLTAILNVLFVPVLGSAGLLLLFDRLFGTSFFIPSLGSAGGGDPLMFQHLFWIFGHPEVYILILPAWGVVADLLSFFARKPAYWYKGTVGSMIAVTVVSGVVYAHHMYLAGISPLLGLGFEILTLAISFPAIVLFVNWLRTLWGGSLKMTPPMQFALGTVFVFGLGGLTGLLLGTISTDVYLHDTMYVVGHFHLTMASSSFLASFAALYFWFPKMFGRELNRTLGTIHATGSVFFLTLTFGSMLFAGLSGQQRRLFDPYQYDFIRHLASLNRFTSISAFCLFTVQAVFVVNFISALFSGKKAEENPWKVGTLEWTLTTSPPIVENYHVIPNVVRGPHELSNPDIQSSLGRDWVGQAEAAGASPVAKPQAAAH